MPISKYNKYILFYLVIPLFEIYLIEKKNIDLIYILLIAALYVNSKI